MTNTIRTLIIVRVFRSLNFAGPIYTLFLLAKGFSLQQVLTLGAINVVSSILFEIPTGVFADTFGRKWSIATGSFFFALAWYIWLIADSFAGFAVMYTVFGLANAFWSGADQALIYDELQAIKKESAAQKVFSRYEGAAAGSFALAAVIGGVLTATHNLETFYPVIFLSFISSVLAFIFTLTIRESRHSYKGDAISRKETSALKQFTVGLSLLQKNPKLRKITFFSTLTISFLLMELFQVYFTRANVPAVWFGYILAISSLLVGAVKWFAYKLEEWFGVEKSMLIIAIVPALFLAVIAFVIHPIAAVILFILGDVTGNIRDPIIADYQNRHIAGQHRATVLSTISFITNGYVAIMLPLMGWVADRNLSLAFVIVAAIILISTFVFRIRADDVIATS